MKVTILNYNEQTLNYETVTRKGRTVFVDPFVQGATLHPKEAQKLVGKFYKLRNDSELYVGEGGEVDVYLPTCYQWYELCPITGKKLKTIAVDEL